MQERYYNADNRQLILVACEYNYVRDDDVLVMLRLHFFTYLYLHTALLASVVAVVAVYFERKENLQFPRIKFLHAFACEFQQ